MLTFFPRGVLDEILNLIESVSEDFPSYSFIPGDSTAYQLLHTYLQFYEAVDSGKEVRVVFFDISKAFDRVWHRRLLHKLSSLGITGNLLKCFFSYLSNRK